MNIFEKLAKAFAPAPKGRFYNFSVRCNRCGEIIQGQVNIYNDPSLEYDANDKPYYICRKVLIGSGRCFQPIEVVLTFDESRRIVNRQITGGEFVGE